MSNDIKIMMVAGEASGDMHCANLATKLKELCPSINIFGMGGNLMARAGVLLDYDISDLSVMGITEVLGKFPLILSRLKGLKKIIDQRKPNAIIFVDFPDFNMRLLPYVYKRNIPSIYFIPPKAWAWRKERANTIAKYTTAVASIFPFEAEVYRQAGANVFYVGHPLLDAVKPSISKEEVYKKFQLDSSKPIIGLMPGSRKKEIGNLFSVMLDSAKIIKSKFPDCQFILPIASTIPREMIPENLNPPIKIIESSDAYNMMSITDLIIMASGTATLESAFMLAPMLVIYKVSKISWIVMKKMVNPEIKSTALPNIIAKKMIVPELLQSEANANNISQIAFDMLDNPQKLIEQKKELQKVREQMGNIGAIGKTAKLVLQFINFPASL